MFLVVFVNMERHGAILGTTREVCTDLHSSSCYYSGARWKWLSWWRRLGFCVEPPSITAESIRGSQLSLVTYFRITSFRARAYWNARWENSVPKLNVKGDSTFTCIKRENSRTAINCYYYSDGLHCERIRQLLQ